MGKQTIPMGEVSVSTSPGDEKLVSESKEQSGQTEIPWIVDSTIYGFRLYGASQPYTPIDSVQVRRDLESAPMALRQLADEVMRGNIDMAELSEFIATVMPGCLHGGKFREIFPGWERHGFHVTPVHFYQPIPNTQTLPETLWNRPSELVGIDMNEQVQVYCGITFQNFAVNVSGFQPSRLESRAIFVSITISLMAPMG